MTDSDPPDSPSSELSFLSRSPSPPSGYPTPPSSNDSSAKASPLPDETDSPTTSSREDGPPPAKRRRVSGPKPRSTAYLDLRCGDVETSQKPQLDSLLKVLHKKRKIVVIAGAGISVSAGIPDFRSTNGLFKTLRNDHKLKSSGKDLFDASVYKDNKSTATFHAMVHELANQTKQADPTPFHHLLATLADEGRLLRLYSQNVDFLDTRLPPLATSVPLVKPWPRTIQLHGGLDKMVCSKCRKVSDLISDLFKEPIPPPCSSCLETDNARTEFAGKRSHGIGKMRPRMVLYNEDHPDADTIGSVTHADLKARPDAVIVVGTTLKVPGVRRIAREMCNVVRDRRDGMTVWLNNDPEPAGKDLEWDIVVQGPCDEVARLASMRRWDDPKEDFDGPFEEVAEAEAQRRKQNGQVVVEIPRTPRKELPRPPVSPLTPVPSPNSQKRRNQLPIIKVALSKLSKSSNGASHSAAKEKPNMASIQGFSDLGLGQLPTAKAIRNPRARPRRKKADKKTSQKVTDAFTISKVRPQTNNELKLHFANVQSDTVNVKLPKHHFERPTGILDSITPAPMQTVSPTAKRNNSSPPYAPPLGMPSVCVETKSGSYTEVSKTSPPSHRPPRGFENLID